jgi:hypothetical protein
MKMRVPFALTLFLAGFGASSAFADTIYSNIPGSLPSDWDHSQSYSAWEISELGARVNPNPGATGLTSATVGVSNWTTDPGNAGATLDVAMTLNLYNVGALGAVGSQFATDTVTAHIAWRPADDNTNCANGAGQYLAADLTCESGQASYVNFTFTGVSLPTDFIYGLSFAATGPAAGLNFGFTLDSPSAGTTFNNDVLYVNTTNPNTLGAGGGTLGQFGPNSGWQSSGNAGTPVIQFDAVNETPEPATFGLIGIGLLAAAIGLRKKARGI